MSVWSCSDGWHAYGAHCYMLPHNSGNWDFAQVRLLQQRDFAQVRWDFCTGETTAILGLLYRSGS